MDCFKNHFNLSTESWSRSARTTWKPKLFTNSKDLAVIRLTDLWGIARWEHMWCGPLLLDELSRKKKYEGRLIIMWSIKSKIFYWLHMNTSNSRIICFSSFSIYLVFCGGSFFFAQLTTSSQDLCTTTYKVDCVIQKGRLTWATSCQLCEGISIRL